MSTVSTRTTLDRRRRKAVAPAAYSIHPIYVQRGAGSYVWDTDGERYLDWTSGIAVMNVGHSHPKVLAAVRAQAEEFQHLCFAVAMHESYIRLCERLAEIAPGPSEKRAFLINSGAEAVENAVKIARVTTGRQAIVSFTHAFHGRTHLALSLTGKANPYKQGFAPRAAELYRAPYPYHYRNPWGADTEDQTGERALAFLADFIRTTIGETEVAGIVLEPIAGEGGFIPAPRTFLEGLRKLCDDIGALWIDDEVQAGMGRTGHWWAVDRYGLEPDLVTTAKALSSGFPLSAVVGKASIMDGLEPGMLGSTFGGNPVSCAAALATIDVIETEGLLDRAAQIGEAASARLATLQREFAALGDVRVRGAMVGLEFVAPNDRQPNKSAVDVIVRYARDHGLLLLPTGTYGNVIRLLPPLNLSDEELDEGLATLEAAVRHALAPVTAVA